MRYGFVCNLTGGVDLHADKDGDPFLIYTQSIMPHCGEIVPGDNPKWCGIIEQWLADPNHDCLRARGDVRWTAACSAVQMMKRPR